MRTFVLLLLVIWCGIPAYELARHVIWTYDPTIGRMIPVHLGASELATLLSSDEIQLVQRVAASRAWTLFYVVAASVPLACVAAEMLPRAYARLLTRVLLAVFFVPPIVKALGWSRLFDSWATFDRVGLEIYATSSYLLLFYGAYRTQRELRPPSVNMAIREFYRPSAAMSRQLAWGAPGQALAAICAFSLLLFAGDELRRFRPDMLTLGDLEPLFDPANDQSSSFALLILSAAGLLMAAISYGLSRLVLGSKYGPAR